jgi:hypothetical protein
LEKALAPHPDVAIEAEAPHDVLQSTELFVLFLGLLVHDGECSFRFRNAGRGLVSQALGLGGRLLRLRSRGLCLFGAALHLLGRGVGLLSCLEQLLQLGVDLFQLLALLIGLLLLCGQGIAQLLYFFGAHADWSSGFLYGGLQSSGLGVCTVCAVAPLINRMNALNHKSRFIVSPFRE